MKRLFTLILMLAILLTFTQKVTAFVPVLNTETASVVNCSLPLGSNDSYRPINNTACVDDDTPQDMDCQNDCDFMTVLSALHFIEHVHTANQAQSQITYQTGSSVAPSYFPEYLYRPPFLN